MNERTPFPLAPLTFLLCFTLGAAVIGLELAPKAGDLVVHNAAGQTLAAPVVRASVTVGATESTGNSTQRKPAAHYTVVLHPAAPGTSSVSSTSGPPTSRATGDAIVSRLLRLLNQVATSKSWAARGDAYVFEGPIADLLSVPSTEFLQTTLQATAWVEGGDLVALHLHASLIEGSVTQTSDEVFTFSRIGGYAPPPVRLAA